MIEKDWTKSTAIKESEFLEIPDKSSLHRRRLKNSLVNLLKKGAGFSK
ncbi:MAG TPA: hypothetical protein VEQ18_02985 [Candidatus Nitrosocosmicus sp.]|nr:hypothetical protein [Candidatus Nitrosocosmicus sp.]